MMGAEVLHRYIILHENWILDFCQITFFDPFWSTLAVNGGQKDKKLPTSLKMPPKVENMHRDIIYDYRFYAVTHLGQITSVNHLWSTLGVKWGTKRVKNVHSSKNNAQKLKLCTHRFDSVTHLGYINIVETF